MEDSLCWQEGAKDRPQQAVRRPPQPHEPAEAATAAAAAATTTATSPVVPPPTEEGHRQLPRPPLPPLRPPSAVAVAAAEASLAIGGEGLKLVGKPSKSINTVCSITNFLAALFNDELSLNIGGDIGDISVDPKCVPYPTYSECQYLAPVCAYGNCTSIKRLRGKVSESDNNKL